MPFTPFHLGPGLAMKAVGGRAFSFLIFAGSQVLIDIEPLVRILRGDSVLHGFTHTYLGATLVALVAAGVGKPICQWLLTLMAASPDRPVMAISWPVAIVTALVGTHSHVFLDSIMHTDMRPLWPLAHGNGLLGLVSVGTLHLTCVVAGGLGAVSLGALTARNLD